MDDQNLTKLDSQCDYLPIRDGKKINLRTLEVIYRTKEDYFTSFCNVRLVKETKNANKFFKDIMPVKENREYLRKSLGYMFTGDTKARCWFIHYGTGKNGKSVLMTNLMKSILGPYYLTCDKSILIKTTTSSGLSPEKWLCMAND